MSLESPPRLKNDEQLGPILRNADNVAMSAERIAANGAAIKATIASGLVFGMAAKITVIAVLLVGGVVVQRKLADREPTAGSGGVSDGSAGGRGHQPAPAVASVVAPQVVEPAAADVAKGAAVVVESSAASVANASAVGDPAVVAPAAAAAANPAVEPRVDPRVDPASASKPSVVAPDAPSVARALPSRPSTVVTSSTKVVSPAASPSTPARVAGRTAPMVAPPVTVVAPTASSSKSPPRAGAPAMAIAAAPSPSNPPPARAVAPIASPVVTPSKPVAVVSPAASPTNPAPTPSSPVASSPVGASPVVPTPAELPPAASDLPDQIKLYEAARAAKSRKEFAVALARLDELMRRFPATPLRPDVDLTRAELLMLSDRLGDAAIALDKLANDPAHRGRRGELLRTLGDVRRKQKDCPGAIDAYMRAREAKLSAQEASRVERGIERCQVAP